MGGDIDVGVGVGGVANNQWSQRRNCKTRSCLWAEFTAGAVHLPKKKKEQKCQLKRNHISIN